MMTAERLAVYDLKVDLDENGCAIVADQPATTTLPSDRVHELATLRIFDNPAAKIDYATAVHDVLSTNPDLHSAYLAELNAPPTVKPFSARRATPQPDDPSAKVHAKVIDYMQTESCNSYALAAQKVLDADPELKRDYVAWSSN